MSDQIQPQGQVVFMMTAEQFHDEMRKQRELIVDEVRNTLSTIVTIDAPLKRSEVMELLQIKSVKTFNKRIADRNIISVGQIGPEPAYRYSQFFN